ncbi:MAG: TolC family protein [Thermoanaerobaculia bacterium]|nr:TolC family protein [Thermoanaerobaculia bacterium]
MIALLLLLAAPPAPALAAAPPGAPAALPVEKAVELALTGNPELLDAVDRAALSAASLSATRSQFLPQVTPFLSPAFRDGGAPTVSRYGLAVSEQLPFGPRLSGVVETSQVEGGEEWSSLHAVTLSQPLLRGLDPAVTREPLRAARRGVETQDRNLAVQKRFTVVAVWGAYLSAVLQDELLREAAGRTARAGAILEASRAKEQAESVSRLDVLRAEQLLAQARSQENDARNAREDAHDLLARLLGRPAGSRWNLSPPERLPVAAPGDESLLAAALSSREEIVEARERVKDAEAQLRIAKSLLLPSLDAGLTWSATGSSSGFGGALGSPGASSWTLGFSSQAPLNLGTQLAARSQAEVSLRSARRAAETLEADVLRQVRSAARRLGTARERLALDEANEEVARMQLEVAQLRFGKGLTDNFFVVDAEGLYNAARGSLVTSRQQVLLDELRLLSDAGLLRPEEFLPRAASPP